MKLPKDIIDRSLEWAAIEQTALEYTEQGYSVERQAKVGNFVADLLARKGDEMIVFEFKSGSWDKEKARQVTEYRNYVVHNFSAEFKLVLVSGPEEKQIYIEGIEDILHEWCFENMSQVDQLATHVYLDEIADVEITSVDINKDSIEVHGHGTAGYELQYGSDSDVRDDFGFKESDYYPFTFHLELDHDLQLQKMHNLDIDTSSFYE